MHENKKKKGNGRLWLIVGYVVSLCCMYVWILCYFFQYFFMVSSGLRELNYFVVVVELLFIFTLFCMVVTFMMFVPVCVYVFKNDQM